MESLLTCFLYYFIELIGEVVASCFVVNSGGAVFRLSIFLSENIFDRRRNKALGEQKNSEKKL
jgi:hypothetical protein